MNKLNTPISSNNLFLAIIITSLISGLIASLTTYKLTTLSINDQVVNQPVEDEDVLAARITTSPGTGSLIQKVMGQWSEDLKTRALEVDFFENESVNYPLLKAD